MTHFTIFGTGNMANSIGSVLASARAAVDYIAHEDSGNAEITGGVVILAASEQISWTGGFSLAN